MFFLISFVIAKNYCIGQQTEEQCKNICKNFNGNFDVISSEIPQELESNTDTNEKHIYYIANNVSYTDTNQTFIFCDQSFHLIYTNPGSQIKIKDKVYLNSNKILNNVPILFKYDYYDYYSDTIEIDVETDEKSDIKPMIFEIINGNFEFSFKFLTDNIPENLIFISNDSKNIKINEITKQVQRIFNDAEKLSEKAKNYYCISDKKTEKCSGYNSIPTHHYVDSVSDVTFDYSSNNIIIIDTTVPQIFEIYSNLYIHIIALPNSDVTFCRYNQPSDFYVILHKDYIEMQKLYFEGEGNLTFEAYSKFYLTATSKENKNNFSMRNKYLYNKDCAQILALRNDTSIELDNKINVLEYSLFYGPKCLSGLFETDKFLSSNDGELILNNITSENLTEYNFKYLTYYFEKGNHEIPKTWKQKCTFRSKKSNETNLIFNDVYSYDGFTIDYIINVNDDYLPSFNMITIRPANYFYLRSFKSHLHYKNIEKYTIQVDKDFVMYGNGPYWPYDDDEISHDQCKITGNGTINFVDENFIKVIKEFCKIDDGIQLKVISKNTPSFYVCIGQSDVETCKSKINNISSIQNAEWIWPRSIETIYSLRNIYNYIYSYIYIYITDKYEYIDPHYLSCKITLTEGSHLTLLYEESYHVSLYKNYITYRNHKITADDSTAKLTVSCTNRIFRIYYYQPITEFNFRYYLNSNTCNLQMKYIENFTEDSIKLDGKCLIKIREPYQSRLGIFKKSNSIFFTINKDSDYHQICYNDKPVEMESLYDFILCNKNEDLKNAGSKPVYVFKDVSLNYANYTYNRNHYFYGNITVFTNFPNNVTLVFNNGYYQIRQGGEYHNTYDYYFYYDSSETKFIFNITDAISLDYRSSSQIKTNVSFTSSSDQIYIFPYPKINNLKNNLNISISDKLTIYSPVPNYLVGLFGDHSIEYSKNWAYYHLSEKSKNLYGNYPSNLFSYIENDEELPINIVLAVDPTDILKVPLNWLYMHNVYIYQDINNDLLIDKPLNISYLIDGVAINYKMKIVAGFAKANVPNLFTVNSYLLDCYNIKNFPYELKIDITENTHTDLYVGIIYNSIVSDTHNIIKIYNRNPYNSLTINATNARNMSEFRYLSSIKDQISKIRYYIDYDYICYCSYSDHSSKCPGNYYFLIDDISTLYEAVADYPELIVVVAHDLDIPYTTGFNFRLMPLNENITIDLPYSPESMTISENNVISFNYSDSSYYEILNKSSIDVVLTDSFKLIVNSNTDSKIRFTLKSNVFASAEMNYNANFSIDVIENSYHLYTEDIDQFGDLLKDSLSVYTKVCACEKDTEDFCTFSRKESIETIFSSSYTYNEIEIAPLSTEKQIYLPSINNPVLVYVLSLSSALTLDSVKNIHITKNCYIINDYWNFTGDIGILKFKVNQKVSLSITEQITTPIVLQLKSDQTDIDLKNCIRLYNSSITIIKHGNNPNTITVFGQKETFFNFTSNLGNHDDITIIHNSTQKYNCLCIGNKACNKCSEGIDGKIERSNKIKSDPGENVKIRVFSDFEIPSSLFNNEHDVFIDEGCTLNLTDIDTVDQDIDDGIKVDKLRFFNTSYLRLKPNDISLNIKMKKKEKGQYFTIEMDTFLRLNVTNIEEKDIKSSRLHVNGSGELNCYDYPFERIRPAPKVRVIKGVYIICEANEGSDICSYQSHEMYKRLGHCHNFVHDFDYNSKILVFLDSYTSCLYAHLNYLHNQKVQFIRKKPKKSNLLDEKEPVKLKFLSTTEIVNKEDSTTGVSNTDGGAILDNSDSDLFVVGFDDKLMIKQEGNSTSDTNTITIQPMSDKGTIVIDDSVNIKNQKLKIETEDNKKVSLTIRTNQNVSEDELNKYIESDKSTVSIDFDSPLIKRKGLPIGAIIGIVVGAVAIVAVIVVIVIILVRQKKLKNAAINENNNDLSDSTF